MRFIVCIALLLLNSSPSLAKKYAQAPEETNEFELDLQVDHNGTLSQNKFRLNWGSAESTLKSITVINAETNELLQNIKMPPELNVIYKDIFTKGKPENGFKDKILDLVGEQIQ